jgi:serine/threonine-protein phosphatase 2A regulatory subunit B
VPCKILTCSAADPVRCFGDKGDVEDITEGNYQLPSHSAGQSTPSASTDMCTPADIISTVEFDHTGNYLATGDKGGRVVLFERNETVVLPAALDSFVINH